MAWVTDERGEEWVAKAMWLGFVVALGTWLAGRFEVGLRLFG